MWWIVIGGVGVIGYWIFGNIFVFSTYWGQPPRRPDGSVQSQRWLLALGLGSLACCAVAGVGAAFYASRYIISLF